MRRSASWDLFGGHAELEKIFHISNAMYDCYCALLFAQTLYSNWYWSDAVMFSERDSTTFPTTTRRLVCVCMCVWM